MSPAPTPRVSDIPMPMPDEPMLTPIQTLAATEAGMPTVKEAWRLRMVLLDTLLIAAPAVPPTPPAPDIVATIHRCSGSPPFAHVFDALFVAVLEAPARIDVMPPAPFVVTEVIEVNEDRTAEVGVALDFVRSTTRRNVSQTVVARTRDARF